MKRTFSLVSNSSHTRCKHFLIIFNFSGIQGEYISINGMIVMISGIAPDHPDSLSHLRAFPDHFKMLHDPPNRPDRT